jgi:hypothetical protein
MACDAYKLVLEESLEQLKQGNISQEGKRYFVEMAKEMDDKISEKDTENKKFFSDLFRTGACFYAIALNHEPNL